MNATPFAAAEARLGAAITARLANARLVPEGGVAVPVVFSRPAQDMLLGQAGMQAHQLLATGSAALLGDAVQRDTRVQVFYDDQLTMAAGQYLVRQRDDDFEAGLARLQLELTA